MATYNTLEWRNENALTGYPLAVETQYPSVLVDASFVQFDNHVPTLNTIKVDSSKLTIVITFDYGKHTAIEFQKSDYDAGEHTQHIRIYQPQTGRYLGTITFGVGVLDLWNSSVGSVIEFNAKFYPFTVRSIPKQDAVYTLDGNYGAVTLSRGSIDTTMFYNTLISGGYNAVVFNAVGGHAIDTNTINGTPSTGPQGLRKINLVSPVANNINIVPNDVVKVSPLNAASLTISLAAGTPTPTFTIPSLNT
jgi:hypothetical protein